MKYKIVGWYSQDTHNEHVAPFARVVFIETDKAEDASELGSDALDKLYEGASVDLLNWYTTELK